MKHNDLININCLLFPFQEWGKGGEIKKEEGEQKGLNS